MLKPITREEIFLAKAIGETVPDLEPIIRQEMFLAKIAGMDIATPVPVTREERYLNAIANKEVIDLKPITRREMFLAKAMGADIEVPSPITRIEYYLSQLTGGGGSYEKYSWEGVFASIDKGTYATDYAIGDMIPLDLGSEGLINMQIAAFDTDDLADGSGKAPITWIADRTQGMYLRINPTLVDNGDGTYQEGTGTIGGWEKCALRTYLNETVKPLIPESIRSNIKEVVKSQKTYDVVYNKSTQTTMDYVWVPDYDEVGDSTRIYGGLFPDQISLKNKGGNYGWWMRSVYDKYSNGRWYACYHDGSISKKYADSNTLAKIRLCFCT